MCQDWLIQKSWESQLFCNGFRLIDYSNTTPLMHFFKLRWKMNQNFLYRLVPLLTIFESFEFWPKSNSGSNPCTAKTIILTPYTNGTS